jgi:heterodisulfide reductase subunit B
VEQLLALSLDASPSEVGLDRHMVSTGGLVRKLAARSVAMGIS